MEIDELKKGYEARIAELNDRITELEKKIEIYRLDNEELKNQRSRLYEKVKRGRTVLINIGKLVDIYKHNDLIVPEIEFERKINDTTIKSIYLNNVLSLKEGILDCYIADLSLSVRAECCLQRAGVYTVRDLLENYKDRNALYRIRNLGSRCRDEIIKVLAEKGVDVTQYKDGEQRELSN